MLLLITLLFALVCFVYAFILAIRLISQLDKPEHQRSTQYIIKNAWKATGIMLCGVIPLAYVLFLY